MPQEFSQPPPNLTAHPNLAFDADAIFQKITALRQSIVDAWQERAVTFTPEEQHRLKEEIGATASLLHDLIMNG
ncbi:hypothetical protein [Sphingobium sp. LSP13-1-1.1]|uniref:hypothetical protein n=1 Tax=Sphingobium sp. LSP13-1-1.1 TaxID=3135234 RepID=UPI00341A4D6F